TSAFFKRLELHLRRHEDCPMCGCLEGNMRTPSYFSPTLPFPRDSAWGDPGWSRIVGAALLSTFLLFATNAGAQNDAMVFSRGALIIPEQAFFQSPCGAVSAYGLVWKLLQSNQPGHYNAPHPITVYVVINGAKRSPNRCVPSDRTAAPTPNAAG